MLEQPLVDRLLAEHSQIRENYLRYLTGRHNGDGFTPADNQAAVLQGGKGPVEGGAAYPQPLAQLRTEVPTVKFMALSGPTGVGASWLIDNYSAKNSFDGMPFVLDSTIVTDNSDPLDVHLRGIHAIAL